jgi:hypothetical protein
MKEGTNPNPLEEKNVVATKQHIRAGQEDE